jgi:hemerythrin
MSRQLLREIRRQHREEHAVLDALTRRLLGEARDGDPRQTREAWAALERRLTSHLAFEEDSLFPLVEPRHAKELRELSREHVRIRALMTEIGLAMQLSVVRKGALEALAALLASHTAHEDANLDLWLDQMAPMDDRRHLPRLFVDMMRAELHA